MEAIFELIIIGFIFTLFQNKDELKDENKTKMDKAKFFGKSLKDSIEKTNEQIKNKYGH